MFHRLQELSQNTIDKLFSKNSRVLAASSTKTKVSGLSLATRELYFSQIADVLKGNFDECVESAELRLDKKDLEDCAAEVEYAVFKANTTLMMYRNNLAKVVSAKSMSYTESSYYILGCGMFVSKT